jgi:hypothetical protein
VTPRLWSSHADARLRGGARGRDDGVRQELAAANYWPSRPGRAAARPLHTTIKFQVQGAPLPGCHWPARALFGRSRCTFASRMLIAAVSNGIKNVYKAYEEIVEAFSPSERRQSVP